MPTVDRTQNTMVTAGFDMAAVVADGANIDPASGSAVTAFGQNNGSVILGLDSAGAVQGRPVYLGSAKGDTNVLGYDINLLAPGTTDSDYAQIGYHDSTRRNPDGNITVLAANNINISAGQVVDAADVGQESYAKIGHGG